MGFASRLETARDRRRAAQAVERFERREAAKVIVDADYWYRAPKQLPAASPEVTGDIHPDARRMLEALGIRPGMTWQGGGIGSWGAYATETGPEMVNRAIYSEIPSLLARAENYQASQLEEQGLRLALSRRDQVLMKLNAELIALRAEVSRLKGPAVSCVPWRRAFFDEG